MSIAAKNGFCVTICPAIKFKPIFARDAWLSQIRRGAIISEFDYWYARILDRLIARYGAQIGLKTLQKILYFNSLDALVAAINNKHIVVESATLAKGMYARIKTESVAKYIANQYVSAVQHPLCNKNLEVKDEIDAL
ncbi:hypothetical protein P886_2377 [Alteromonadaceae bacterium 2753L.S.0a.02]|nr:hypothetical protein P886_2377 [Alteromonadaceae bacterium 2753L.S.0a.02]